MLSVTMAGYPALTGMIVNAPQLIEVLFGVRWPESVLPFQIPCGAGMFKLLKMYASSATQAKGMIWSEVWRQAFFVIVLVLAVVLLSQWGIAGAAAGVLVATAVMTVLLQRLVKRLAELTWRDMLAPQAPAVVCSLGLVTVLLATRGAVGGALGDTGAWVLLPMCLMIGALYYLGFILFSPFHAVRDVVLETINDLAPPAVGKRLEVLQRPRKDLPGLLPR